MNKLNFVFAAFVAACVPANWNPGGFGGGGGGGGAGGPPANTTPAPEHLIVTGAAGHLTRLTSDDAHEAHPMLSPDGTKLLAATWRDEVVDGQYTGNYVDEAVIGMRPDGRGRTTYSRRGSAAKSPAWLQGGKTFVYVTNAMGEWSLVRATKPVPGAAVSVVMRGEDAPSLGSVSAARDAKLLAFHTQIREVWTVGTIHPDGTEMMLLTEGRNPKLSPDGTRLAFERTVGGYTQIFTADAESGSDLTQVTSGDANDGSVEWSPDGKWLVYSSNAGAARFSTGGGETFNLFAIHPDGTGLTQLTDGPAKTTEPSWGSDGYIYFASNEGGNFDLWRVKPALDAGA